MLNSKALKLLIPTFATDDEVRRLCGRFVPLVPFTEMAEHIRKPSNWKRIGKERVAGTILRTFNCAPLDDQLRLYVVTDSSDTVVVNHYFQDE